MITPLTSPRLDDIYGVRHGFFTRRGGVSGGRYRGLNAAWSSGDDPDAIGENRRRIAAEIGVPAEKLLTLQQVHSPDVIRVEAPWGKGESPCGDGMVTAEKGIAIGVLTADCAPVLFGCPSTGVIGAAHAGWKGALSGVLEATIEAMIKIGARREDITAAVGPSIGPNSYEVSENFKTPFLEQAAENIVFFRPATRPGHLMFDMPAYVARRLEISGIAADMSACKDTLPDEEHFFSYRRATLRDEKDYGRQMSVIALV